MQVGSCTVFSAQPTVSPRLLLPVAKPLVPPSVGLEAAFADYDRHAARERGDSARDRAADRGGSQDDPPDHARQIPPGWPPARAGSRSGKIPHPGHRLRSRQTPSACEMHREWIEEQVELGRNAQSIYQDLVERFGLTPPLQLGQALRARAQGARTGALRRARVPAGRRSAGRFWPGRPDTDRERQIPPAVSVRDDVEVLRQELSQGGVESRSRRAGRVCTRKRSGHSAVRSPNTSCSTT